MGRLLKNESEFDEIIGEKLGKYHLIGDLLTEPRSQDAAQSGLSRPDRGGLVQWITMLERRQPVLSRDELDVLRELIERHLDGLVLYARSRCEAPEDVVQEALLEMTCQDPLPSDPIAWLFQAVRWRAANHRRGAKRHSKHIETLATQRKSWFDDSDIEQEFSADELEAAIQRLPEDLKEIVVLKTWSDRTLQEIADQMNLSRTQVHRKYWSAVAELKQILTQSQASPNTSEYDRRAQ